MSTILDRLTEAYVTDLKDMKGGNSFMEYFRTLSPSKRKTAAQCFLSMGYMLKNEILKCKHEHTEQPYPDCYRCKDCGATKRKVEEPDAFWPTYTEWTI